ncbi:alcohol dehydrogenase [Fomitiporia mediterranea MF3/22]|uniref:alcohol dehydrogenase n=1 Tax=Fomitiporia mediterranea (strain MF3/22) TaxID=694068 RepID=UPI0004409B80|nr:alcohol dehydrogenase [Fomitiporia mediterranea MF3/22]EJD02968.1 alcohol dehydrogenase [Fomitiporia mediterranea MF3/22]
MRAFVINAYAHPSQIHLSSDAPEPRPTGNEVIVEVYSAGLNFFDILQAQGKYQNQPPFPFVLGSEFAGKIASDFPIPKGCPFKPGDRVFGVAQGAYADRVAADWQHLVPLPKAMTYDQGAGLHITWPTSYEALVGRAELKPGEWVLVTAAAGGVGLAAVQLAKALGANVIAAVGSPAKMDVCKKYGGADFAVDYTSPNWQKEVMSITKGKGVDVIYDPVGRIRDCLKCIAWKGRAIVVGFAGGQIEKLPMNLVLLKNIAVTGIHWGAYSKFEPARVPVVWRELISLFESGRVKPVVYSEIYDLTNLAAGLRAIEERKTWGKAIVRVREDDGSVARACAKL